jgi:hypothetical protein
VSALHRSAPTQGSAALRILGATPVRATDSSNCALVSEDRWHRDPKAVRHTSGFGAVECAFNASIDTVEEKHP